MGRSQWDKELDPGRLGQSTRESGMVCMWYSDLVTNIIIGNFNNFYFKKNQREYSVFAPLSYFDKMQESSKGL